MTLLEVRDLAVRIGGAAAVDGVGFDLEPGRRVGLVGESGAGKSLTGLALTGLLPEGAGAEGSVRLHGEELLGDARRMQSARGAVVGTVFQNATASLNPVMRVGRQIAEPMRKHWGQRYADAVPRVLELLERVQLSPARERINAYPHELSGGQRQRVMLAIAIACRPELLIADEPTTALDVTIQAEILRLLDRLISEDGTALILISHDLPVVARLCDELHVMYGGRIVEHGPTAEVLRNPCHPYTSGLLAALPQVRRAERRTPLPAIRGVVPPLGRFPAGCPFRDRCSRADASCGRAPRLGAGSHRVACWHPLTQGSP